MSAEVFRIDAVHPQAAALDRAAEALSEGGIALFPTETVYVIGSLVRTGAQASAGVGRLIDFKRRGGAPSFPWLVSSHADLDTYGTALSDEAYRLAEKFWPGGLALVVQASSAIPRSLTREDGTISLRLSSSPVVSGLLGILDKPIVSSGANFHGHPSPLDFGDVDPEILAAVDVALDAGTGESTGRSTIVDCSHGPAVVLREGVVSREEIDDALGYRTPLV